MNNYSHSLPNYCFCIASTPIVKEFYNQQYHGPIYDPNNPNNQTVLTGNQGTDNDDTNNSHYGQMIEQGLEGLAGGVAGIATLRYGVYKYLVQKKMSPLYKNFLFMKDGVKFEDYFNQLQELSKQLPNNNSIKLLFDRATLVKNITDKSILLKEIKDTEEAFKKSEVSDFDFVYLLNNTQSIKNVFLKYSFKADATALNNALSSADPEIRELLENATNRITFQKNVIKNAANAIRSATIPGMDNKTKEEFATKLESSDLGTFLNSTNNDNIKKIVTDYSDDSFLRAQTKFEKYLEDNPNLKEKFSKIYQNYVRHLNESYAKVYNLQRDSIKDLASSIIKSRTVSLTPSKFVNDSTASRPTGYIGEEIKNVSSQFLEKSTEAETRTTASHTAEEINNLAKHNKELGKIIDTEATKSLENVTKDALEETLRKGSQKEIESALEKVAIGFL